MVATGSARSRDGLSLARRVAAHRTSGRTCGRRAATARSAHVAPVVPPSPTPARTAVHLLALRGQHGAPHSLAAGIGLGHGAQRCHRAGGSPLRRAPRDLGVRLPDRRWPPPVAQEPAAARQAHPVDVERLGAASEAEPVKSVMSRALDAAFGRPRGLLGRVGGWLMERTNRVHEQRAVDLASLRLGEHVLVLGHGPGIGLVEAASRVGAHGHVTGVDPSELMRQHASRRCRGQGSAATVDIRAGTAEATGCENESVDVAISVNNVMLWDLHAALNEIYRVLRPTGRLVITVHRHVLAARPDELGSAATAARFRHVEVSEEPRGRSQSIVLLARKG